MSNFEELIGRVAGMFADGLPSRLWEQLRPLLGTFGEAIATKWSLHVASAIRCGHQYRNNRQCDELSVVVCEVCGCPCCLRHASIALETADAICARCVSAALRRRIAEDAASGTTGRWRQRASSRTSKPEDLERARYLRALGLTGSPSWDEVHAAFRKLAAKEHPDRFRAEERDAAEKRFADIVSAYEALRQLYAGAA